MDKIGYVIIIALAVWFVYKQFAPVKGLKNMNAQQFRQAAKGSKVIDVREPHEYKQGHLPGAVNIPLGRLGRSFADIPKETPVFLYCRSGMRSKQAGKVLAKHGYTDVSHLTGGISSWDGPLAM
ncbi:MAG: Rhodanese-related sulfurtransferase [Paenibacillus sp.]|jgi:rhodanese-related sulfurtransferase|uniref:rhodanese-like domain-containing protein n=1 Tax=unclassified Paenibacillus TaxID=185978 RepID=UPI0029F2CA89|nr:Rhodanese-related sulfurtransferase [Paenibacillus sp.]